jgi:hypothetical protein
MTVTTQHPLDQLVQAVEAAKIARNAYLGKHDYQLVERRGVTYAVHPDYVTLFNSYYNASIKGGWFGEGYGSPTWAAITL